MTDETEARKHIRALLGFVTGHVVRRAGTGGEERLAYCDGCSRQTLKTGDAIKHAASCEVGAAQAYLDAEPAVLTVEGGGDGARQVPYPGTEGAPTDNPHDMSRMVNVSTLIANLQTVLDRFGDSCVYIRRGGLAWGAVALNHRSDDEKFGLFDLQAEHDRALIQRARQVERLIADRNEQRSQRWALETELASLRSQLAKQSEENTELRGALSQITNAGGDCIDRIAQLEGELAGMRRAVLEEAVNKCQFVARGYDFRGRDIGPRFGQAAARECAKAIRALIDPKTGEG